MPVHLLTYKCLIISPSDVRDEREVVVAALDRWNTSIGQTLDVRVEAVRWETHARPEMGMPPQDVINAQIVEGSDFGIAVFGSRLGTPTSSFTSGSVEEVERLVGAGARVMVYFSSGSLPRDVDVDQLQALRTFQESMRSRGLFFQFANKEELREHVTHHVTGLVNELAKQHRYPDTSTFIEVRTSDPVSPKEGQIWLRKDL